MTQNYKHDCRITVMFGQQKKIQRPKRTEKLRAYFLTLSVNSWDELIVVELNWVSCNYPRKGGFLSYYLF